MCLRQAQVRCTPHQFCSCSEVQPLGTPAGDGGQVDAAMDRTANVFPWGPVGLGVGLSVVFGSLYEMNYRIEQIIF